jgi:hypothetical protein
MPKCRVNIPNSHFNGTYAGKEKSHNPPAQTGRRITDGVLRLMAGWIEEAEARNESTRGMHENTTLLGVPVRMTA